MGKRTSHPKSVPDCTDPTAATSTKCVICWPKDYEKEISVNLTGRYAEQYKNDGTSHGYYIPRKYKILIPLKTGVEATVEIRIKIEPQGSAVTAADTNAAKTKMENSLSHWNGKFTLQVTHPDVTNCPPKRLPIKFKVLWITTNEHYTMKLHDTYPREGVTGDIIDVSKTTDEWTYAHEYGHLFGLPDEYSYTTDNETVKYYKPDGTQDAAVSAPTYKPSSDASSTIMSTVNKTTVLERHGWFFAIEAKDLIDIAGVTCAIII